VHDILNPVLVVRYSIDAIKRHADSNLIKQLQKTYYGLDQLDAVIKRVKQLRALELGKAKLVREPVPVNDIISDTLHAFESRFQEKKLIADFRLAPQDA